MRIRHVVVTTLAVTAGALLFAAPAEAKGALSATITGPGLSAPLRLVPTDSTVVQFSAFSSGTRADELAFGGVTPTATAPTKQLGPAYQVTYDFGRSVELRLVAYPLAEGGPVISVPPGQRRPYDNAAIPAGWLRGDSGLARTMVRVGVPLQLPSPSRTSATAVAAPPAASTSDSGGTPPVGVAVGLGALVLGALAVWVLRRGRSAAVTRTLE